MSGPNNAGSAVPRLPKGKQGDEVWLPNTTAREAILWASAKFNATAPMLVDAVALRDAARAAAIVKELRHIVTRLDAYHRQCVREWNKSKGVDSEG